MNPDEVARRGEQLGGSAWRRFLQSVPGQILVNPPVHRLHRSIPLRADHRVLEVGCGAGSRLLLLDNNTRFSHALSAGVEPTPSLVSRAGSTFVSRARPLSALAADPASLPFADASYDIALCGDLLRFLDVRGAQSALREIARVLRPGGLLIAWDLAPAAGRFGWWQRFWLRRYPGRIASANNLMSLAERSGFEYSRDAELRPYFWPPIPRVSFVASTPVAPAMEGEG
ncbi:MAG TPA: class I SAM-dependent methyltransferase [Dehalococcoidia bacterium]|jgi:SAM-dependent methyltransferase